MLRPGRFDKKIRVDAPDLEGRRDILEYYLSKMSHDESMDPMILAVETQFYTPADLKYLLNEALRYALFDGRTYMTYRDFKMAQPEHEFGLREPIKNMTKQGKYRLAAHEAAHAIAVRLYKPDWRISRITIIRQGRAYGYVLSMPATESFNYLNTYETLHNQLRVAVAGKAGEMEFGGEQEQTLGVGGDFANIRYVLRTMAGAGMFGPLGASDEPETIKEIRNMMEETFLMALDEVRMDMRLHREMGENLIQLLLEKEELMADEVEEFFDEYGLHTPKPHLLTRRVLIRSHTRNRTGITMSSNQIQPAPKESRFHWEMEESYVDRRNRLPNRIRRYIKRLWLPAIIIGLILSALLSAQLMATILPVLGFVLEISLFILIFLSQFILLFWFLARTRNYTIMPDSGTEGIGFDDYKGQPEILEQAQQIVTLLRGVKAFEGAGGEPLTGLLLEGPPGTGKTWLAQAISTEAKVPFFYMDASGLQAMFIGVGPMKVMNLFRKARKMAKRYGAAVIFLDEIDAVGSRGGVASVGGNDEDNNGMFGGGGSGGMGVLSTMLIEMSGFSQEHGWRARWRSWWYKTILRRKPPKPEKRVLVIGATNRVATRLIPALLRPGRFDKKIRVDVPDMEGRREIFEYYLEKYAHDDSMEAAILASETPGYSPADIKYLLNEALRYAFFDGRNVISYRDFMRSKPEHEMGLQSPLKHMAPEAKRRLAYYQAGKAVAVRLFMPGHRISRITIVRQGMHFGHVWHYPAQESFQGLQIKPELMQRVKVAIAGKGSEIEFCGSTQSVGAGWPRPEPRLWLARARWQTPGCSGRWARRSRMAMIWRVVSSRAGLPEQAKEIEEAYQQVLRETRMALREHTEVVDGLVELLLEKEELLPDEIREFFDQYGLHTPDPSIIRDGEEFHILPPPVGEAELDCCQHRSG